MPISNASLLDEATAAAEAMSLCIAATKKPKACRFLVDKDVFPQTIEVLHTRAEPLDILIEIVNPNSFELIE